MQYTRRLGLKRARVHLFQLFILGFQGQVIYFILHAHIFDLLLQAGNLLFRGLDNVLYRGDFGRLGLAADNVDLYQTWS